MSPADKRGGEVFLPDLQILPGKLEFTYLPVNCQTVFILPLGVTAVGGARGAMIFGGDQKRSFSPRDLAFLRSIGVRLEAGLLADETQ
mmetsp:Transcript_37941/g.119009  ORF Transcript_37941/g.119009 Transcript_37941/m.119009 type:complete len:88 (-) Transcript_37941:122-385(-)